jgi:hypothetical protein
MVINRYVVGERFRRYAVTEISFEATDLWFALEKSAIRDVGLTGFLARC